MDSAKTLLRIIARAFYTTEHILIIDALCLHSTLTDSDLAHVLGMQTKALRRICGKLKEDGLISVHSRGEKKEGAPPSMYGANGSQAPKERLFFRDWYYLDFHRAIDSVKYRLWKLSRHIESLGAPTTEKKDLICPRCKSSYTELEVMDNIGDEGFYCHRCGHVLEAAEENEGPSENESMKRMNDQLAKIVGLMRQIDSTNVPENDFDTALSHALPINRTEANPGPKTLPVDDVKPTLASSKGLALAPEKVSVNVSEDGVKQEEKSELQARREREARQNMLPDWISKSTVNGAITAVGAKEAAQRYERESHMGGAKPDDDVEDKKSKDIIDNAVMDEYWKELKAAQERERQEAVDDEEDDDEDEDDFEDVGVSQTNKVETNSGVTKAASAPTPSTSGMQSSNATDDEREVKRVRLVEPVKTETVTASAGDSNKADSDEDEEFEFEDV